MLFTALSVGLLSIFFNAPPGAEDLTEVDVVCRRLTLGEASVRTISTTTWGNRELSRARRLQRGIGGVPQGRMSRIMLSQVGTADDARHILAEGRVREGRMIVSIVHSYNPQWEGAIKGAEEM